MRASTLRATRRRDWSSSYRRFAALRAARLTTLGRRRSRPNMPRRGAAEMSEAAAVGAIPASQVARRERILDAAMELASDGGWDAVQMRGGAGGGGGGRGPLYT